MDNTIYNTKLILTDPKLLESGKLIKFNGFRFNFTEGTLSLLKGNLEVAKVEGDYHHPNSMTVQGKDILEGYIKVPYA